jgi:hypothetical protein
MRYVDLDNNTVYDTDSMRLVYEVYELYNNEELVEGIYQSSDNRYFVIRKAYEDGSKSFRYELRPTTEHYVKRTLAEEDIDTYVQEFNPRII